MSENNAQVLDLKGLKCPMPVLKARKAMQSFKPGDKAWLETTDPLAVIDIPAFCNEYGHTLIEMQTLETYHRFLVEKG